MKPAAGILAAICVLSGCGSALAQERGTGGEAEPAARPNGLPVERVIAAVAKKTGKKFIVDPRVSGNVEILGQDLSAVTYADLLSILLLNGDTAVETGNYVNVIPESIVRQMPLPDRKSVV